MMSGIILVSFVNHGSVYETTFAFDLYEETTDIIENNNINV